MRLLSRWRLRVLLAVILSAALCVLYRALAPQRGRTLDLSAELGPKVSNHLAAANTNDSTSPAHKAAPGEWVESILRGNDKREIHKKDVPSSRIGKAVIAQESMGRRKEGKRKTGVQKLTNDELQDPNQRRLLENLSQGALHKARRRLSKRHGEREIGQSPTNRDGGAQGTQWRPTYLRFGALDVESYLSGQRMKEGEGDAMKRFQFNQVASDATPPDRSLVDVRHPRLVSECQNSPDQYQSNLPSSSIIICFHNEARSALLRTIASVLNRSPEELVEEIILIDDASKDPDDGQLLSAIPKVHVVRLEERQGLIRARVRGSEEARGPVLTFLDSHCEVVTGWLEPLLSRIKMNSSRVVCPIIDIINKDDMRYVSASPVVKGGFGINLSFKWDTMTQKEQRARVSPIEPIRTPAIAGGLFAVDKVYFHHIGLYDAAMNIWGGENIELSLRVWMCGGEMEVIPCSHVGHIFRSAMPYDFGPGGTYYNTVVKNIRRTAEVWLDDYKDFYYERNPHSKNVPYGDISERLALRDRLHCNSFSWFIRNIYPQFDAPPVQDFTYGQLKSGGLCLTVGSLKQHRSLIMKLCLPNSPYQGWALTSKGGIKQDHSCITYDNSQSTLHINPCNGGESQKFEYLHSSGVFNHTLTGLCLMASSPVTLASCLTSQPSLHWEVFSTGR